jgi:arabinofuranosyltransferase
VSGGPGRGTLVLAGVAGLALAAAGAVRTAGLATDDIYNTSRYAANLAAGAGFVFNPGERVFGLTDPGVGLVLAAARAVTGVAIPLLGTVLTAFALLTLAAVLVRSAGEQGRLAEGLAGGLLILTASYLWTAQGSGPLPALALLLLAARLTETEEQALRPGWRDGAAGLLAGLAVWCRPDAALGAVLLGLLLTGERRRLPWRYGTGLAAAVLPGLLAARLYFGTVVPQTLAAKRQAGALHDVGWGGGWEGIAAFWGRAWGLWRFHVGPLAGPLLAVGLLGLAALWHRGGRPGRLLVLVGLGVAVAYTALGVPFFLWYTVPPAAAVFAGAAWGVGWAVRRASRFGPPARLSGQPAGQPAGRLAGAAAGLIAVVGLAALLAAGGRWWRDPGAGDWRLPAYRAAGLWIRDNTPPEAEVALEEIGIVGYFAARPVRDLVGLVTPASLPYAARGDMMGAFLVRPSELVVFHTFTARGGTRPIVARRWFARSYEEAARIEVAGGAISIYRRRPGSTVPPPRPPRRRRAGSSPRPIVVS